jgi:hypothetical protein
MKCLYLVTRSLDPTGPAVHDGRHSAALRHLLNRLLANFTTACLPVSSTTQPRHSACPKRPLLDFALSEIYPSVGPRPTTNASLNGVVASQRAGLG